MGARIDQLMQIFNRTTWDGDLISKKDRDKLRDAGLVYSGHGYNAITSSGIRYLLDLDLIRMGIRDYDGTLPSGQDKTWYGIGVDNPLLAQLDKLGVVKRRHPLNWSWDERERATQQIVEKLHGSWVNDMGIVEGDIGYDLCDPMKKDYIKIANKILDLLGI